LLFGTLATSPIFVSTCYCASGKIYFLIPFLYMKHYLPVLLAVAALSGGCASIVSHSRWPVAITSVPVGAKVVILNRQGQEVFSGPTPAAVTLNSGSSFFRREAYTLQFSRDGYEPKTTMLTTSVNGWYFGNLLFGGAIGMLIVDPATGSMYRLDQKEVQVALSQGQALNLPEAKPNELQVVSLESVPATLRYKLLPVK
jgi:hypothetical protein